MSVLVAYAIPAFLFLILIEAFFSYGQTRRGYQLRDTFASLSMGLGNVMIAAGTKSVTFALMVVLHRHAIVDLSSYWWAWLLIIPAEDFCYYWFHRSHHQIRFLWAAHINHHSSRHYNLSTALRQSWTTPFTAPIFWLPLPILGFSPTMILVAQAISLVYQFWLHTEHIENLGALESVLNTPSHHRVHHGRDIEYLDKNHAGIFIIWDRLFGTFAREEKTPDYGLTTNIGSHNPIDIAFHEWRAMFAQMAEAPTVSVAVQYMIRPPGWDPGGAGQTTEELQAILRRRAADQLEGPAAT